MHRQILFKYTFFVILLISCSNETENPNGSSDYFSLIPQSLVNCFQQARYMEDIFEADTLTLTTSQAVNPLMVRSIHFSKNGNIYLGSLSSYVLQFDRTGQMIRKIGRNGQGPGEYTWASFVTTNSREELIVGDFAQHKITIQEENGMFLSSFRVYSLFFGLFISAQDDIILDDNYNGRRLERETIYVYGRDGKLLRKFGSVSETSAKLKNVPFTPDSPYLSLFGNHIFAADYPDFKIKKYNMRGHLLKEFGVKYKNWRSLLDSGYEKLPQPQMITAATDKILKEFMKEFKKYPMVHWITNFHPGILAMMTKPPISAAGEKDTYFVFYDIDGNLLSDGLSFRHSFQDNKDLKTVLKSTTPEGFCVLQYNPDNTDILLIRFRFKTACWEEN